MLLQNYWYLDNGILEGNEAELMHSLDTLENEGKDLGINVKTSKCMLWSSQTMSGLDQNIKVLILMVSSTRGSNWNGDSSCKSFIQELGENCTSRRWLTAT